jgi:hypothetical protein
VYRSCRPAQVATPPDPRGSTRRGPGELSRPRPPSFGTGSPPPLTRDLESDTPRGGRRVRRTAASRAEDESASRESRAASGAPGAYASPACWERCRASALPQGAAMLDGRAGSCLLGAVRGSLKDVGRRARAVAGKAGATGFVETRQLSELRTACAGWRPQTQGTGAGRIQRHRRLLERDAARALRQDYESNRLSVVGQVAFAGRESGKHSGEGCLDLDAARDTTICAGAVLQRCRRRV